MPRAASTYWRQISACVENKPSAAHLPESERTSRRLPRRQFEIARDGFFPAENNLVAQWIVAVHVFVHEFLIDYYRSERRAMCILLAQCAAQGE